MEWLSVVGGILSQLLFYGVIVWVIVRLVRGRRDDAPGDQAVSIRRLFVYGLMFATLVLTAVGTVLATQELLGSSERIRDDRSALAFGLALVLVAGPAYGLLLRHVRRQLGATPDERFSFGWAAYLNVALLTSLIATVVTAQQLLEGVVGVEEFERTDVVPVVVWSAVWVMHWCWLKAKFGLPGDVHLAAGSVTGLITLSIGIGGLVYATGDQVYTWLVDPLPVGHEDPVLGRWLIAALLGGLVWSWFWLARFRRADRTALWYVDVVVLGALGGLIATIGAAATIGYRTLVWFLGQPTEALAGEHFEYVLPAATAVLVVGASSWHYHRWVLHTGDRPARSEPLRTYDYVMTASGLVASVVAATLGLVALVEAVTPAPTDTDTGIANLLILAFTLAAIGGPLWWVFWSRIRHHVEQDPRGELESTVRRTYLIVVFGVGGVAVLASLISVLYIVIENLLEGTFDGTTVRLMGVGLSVLTTVTGAAWYHLAVFRADRRTLATTEPTVVPPPPRHVVLVAPCDLDLADELAETTGAYLERWCRTDLPTIPPLDVGDLATRIRDSDAHDVLVVVGPGGASITPFETCSTADASALAGDTGVTTAT